MPQRHGPVGGDAAAAGRPLGRHARVSGRRCSRGAGVAVQAADAMTRRGQSHDGEREKGQT